jgi:hypothetical protein
VAAVEIRVTHAVDAAKARQLAVPFIELEGESLLAIPQYWRSLQDTLPSFICDDCQHAYTRFQQVVAQIASETRVALPAAYYRYAPTDCWRCHRAILVFAWPEAHKNLFPDVEPTIRPRPHTIRLIRSGTAGTAYWGNTCPACHALQGAFFLHMEPDGPFFGFDCGADTTDSFHRDLMVLASRLCANAEQPGPDPVAPPVLPAASAPTDPQPSRPTGDSAPASRSAPSARTPGLCPCGAELERWHIRPTYGSLFVEPCLAHACPNEHLWAATVSDIWCKIKHQTAGASHNVHDETGTVVVLGTCANQLTEIGAGPG